MAKTSVTRDRQTAEVRHLAASGLSQRQIATRLGITRPMVQRILVSYDPASASGSDDELSEFRRELVESLDAVWAVNGGSLLCDGAVDPMLYRLEAAEEAFNVEYGLTRARTIRAAKLRRMMGEGAVLNA